MMIMVLVATACTLFSGLVVAAHFLFPQERPVALERLLEVTRIAAAPVPQQSRARRLAGLASTAGAWLRTHVGVGNDESLQMRLTRAGFKGSTPADVYLSTRILGPLLALLAGSLMPVARLSFMVGLPAVVYLLPELVLGRLIKRRQQKVRRSIPDVIDLLVICVDAGLGLDQAILRVADELSISYPDINDEFLQVNREQRAGRARADAWAGMAERVQVPDIDAFQNMLMQTERFGTPISRALSTFALGVRTKRRQAAEEMAAKTTIKIIFPLVFFIFPAIFIVLLGPAVISMVHGVGGGF